MYPPNPTRQFSPAVLNAGFAPDCGRSRDDDGAAVFDPQPSLVAVEALRRLRWFSRLVSSWRPARQSGVGQQANRVQPVFDPSVPAMTAA